MYSFVDSIIKTPSFKISFTLFTFSAEIDYDDFDYQP